MIKYSFSAEINENDRDAIVSSKLYLDWLEKIKEKFSEKLKKIKRKNLFKQQKK